MKRQSLQLSVTTCGTAHTFATLTRLSEKVPAWPRLQCRPGVVEFTAVTERGRITNGDMGLWSSAHIPPLKRIADFMKSVNVVPAIQIAHAGRKGSMQRPWHGNGPLTQDDFRRGEQAWSTVAPTARALGEGWIEPRAMREGDEQTVLAAFREAPLEPDLLGFNYYVTGERFLDSRIDRYPPHVIGGNGRCVYADVEAVRVCDSGLVGPGPLLIEAFRRFHTPVAVTEAHLGGSAEERARSDEDADEQQPHGHGSEEPRRDGLQAVDPARRQESGGRNREEVPHQPPEQGAEERRSQGQHPVAGVSAGLRLLLPATLPDRLEGRLNAQG